MEGQTKRWHAYRMSPRTGQIEYLGDLGEHDYRHDAVNAAEARWTDLMAERIGTGPGIPSVSIKPETDEYVQQLLAKQVERGGQQPG